jgi:hypothetical protein
MRFQTLALALGLSGLAAQPAASQGPKHSADERELYSFVLTMDKVQHLSGAAKGLHELEKKHPGMSNGGENKSIDEMVGAIRKCPDAVAVLAKNGLSPRDYAVGFLTLIQSTMMVGLKKAGTFKTYPPDMLKLVSQANLAFVEQHYAEIQKLMPDFSAEGDEH